MKEQLRKLDEEQEGDAAEVVNSEDVQVNAERTQLINKITESNQSLLTQLDRLIKTTQNQVKKFDKTQTTISAVDEEADDTELANAYRIFDRDRRRLK